MYGSDFCRHSKHCIPQAHIISRQTFNDLAETDFRLYDERDTVSPGILKGQENTRIVRSIQGVSYPSILNCGGRPELEEDRRLRICALQFNAPLPLSNESGHDFLDAPEFGALIHLIGQYRSCIPSQSVFDRRERRTAVIELTARMLSNRFSKFLCCSVPRPISVSRRFPCLAHSFDKGNLIINVHCCCAFHKMLHHLPDEEELLGMSSGPILVSINVILKVTQYLGVCDDGCLFPTLSLQVRLITMAQQDNRS